MYDDDNDDDSDTVPETAADSKGGGGGAAAAPLLAHIFCFKKPLFRVKSIYFVVRICDK